MIDVIVTQKTLEAENVYSYELTPREGKVLPAFTAGAHIDVDLGNSLVRQYSLCNNPEEENRYLISVLLDQNTRGGSKLMHEQIVNGSTLKISEPRNLFPLVDDANYSVLFAGGIGITPILCMAEHLAYIGAEFELHYCSRSVAAMAFVDRIRASIFSDKVFFHYDNGLEEQKLNTSQLLALPEEGRHLYVCGPNGFMDHVLDSARSAGWSEGMMHREYFALEPPQSVGGAEFEIQIESTGRVLLVPEDKSVAEILIKEGISISLSCEQGICGACLTGVLEGEPEHRDMFLTDGEHEKNDQFTPCCSRAKSARLILDL